MEHNLKEPLKVPETLEFFWYHIPHTRLISPVTWVENGGWMILWVVLGDFIVSVANKSAFASGELTQKTEKLPRYWLVGLYRSKQGAPGRSPTPVTFIKMFLNYFWNPVDKDTRKMLLYTYLGIDDLFD